MDELKDDLRAFIEDMPSEQQKILVDAELNLDTLLPMFVYKMSFSDVMSVIEEYEDE